MATLLAACGVVEFVNPCPMDSIELSSAAIRIGPARALATSCPAKAEVDGREYVIGAGGWLDEDALVLEEYANVTRASGYVDEPTAYALAGVDPRAFLVVKGPDDPELESLGQYMVLHGNGTSYLEAGLCRYADPHDGTPECQASPAPSDSPAP